MLRRYSGRKRGEGSSPSKHEQADGLLAYVVAAAFLCAIKNNTRTK